MAAAVSLAEDLAARASQTRLTLDALLGELEAALDSPAVMEGDQAQRRELKRSLGSVQRAIRAWDEEVEVPPTPPAKQAASPWAAEELRDVACDPLREEGPPPGGSDEVPG